MKRNRVFVVLLVFSLVASQTAFAAEPASADPTNSDVPVVEGTASEPTADDKSASSETSDAEEFNRSAVADEAVDPDADSDSSKEASEKGPAEEKPAEGDANPAEQQPSETEKADDKTGKDPSVKESGETPTSDEGTSQKPAEKELKPNPVLERIAITELITTNKNGKITLNTGGALSDVLFPSRIKGYDVTTITANAFRGTSYFRTITIPASITAIGDNAFADCNGLEYIILQDRYDTADLTLGENWCGDATVIFALV